MKKMFFVLITMLAISDITQATEFIGEDEVNASANITTVKVTDSKLATSHLGSTLELYNKSVDDGTIGEISCDADPGGVPFREINYELELDGRIANTPRYQFNTYQDCMRAINLIKGLNDTGKAALIKANNATKAIDQIRPALIQQKN